MTSSVRLGARQRYLAASDTSGASSIETSPELQPTSGQHRTARSSNPPRAILAALAGAIGRRKHTVQVSPHATLQNLPPPPEGSQLAGRLDRDGQVELRWSRKRNLPPEEITHAHQGLEALLRNGSRGDQEADAKIRRVLLPLQDRPLTHVVMRTVYNAFAAAGWEANRAVQVTGHATLQSLPPAPEGCQLAGRLDGDGQVELRWSRKRNLPPEEVTLARRGLETLLRNGSRGNPEADAKIRRVLMPLQDVPLTRTAMRAVYDAFAEVGWESNRAATWLDHLEAAICATPVDTEQLMALHVLRQQTRGLWMQNQLTPRSVTSCLSRAAGKCDSLGLVDLANVASAMALQSNGSRSGQLCPDKVRHESDSRSWDKAFLRALCKDMPEEIRQATGKLGQSLANELQKHYVQSVLLFDGLKTSLSNDPIEFGDALRDTMNEVRNSGHQDGLNALKRLLRTEPSHPQECMALQALLDRVLEHLGKVTGPPSWLEASIRWQADLEEMSAQQFSSEEASRLDEADRLLLSTGVLRSTALFSSVNRVSTLAGLARKKTVGLEKQDALLGALLFLCRSHSLHDVIRTIDGICNDPLRFSRLTEHGSIADFDAYIQSFTNPRVFFALDKACDTAWDSLMDDRRRIIRSPVPVSGKRRNIGLTPDLTLPAASTLEAQHKKVPVAQTMRPMPAIRADAEQLYEMLRPQRTQRGRSDATTYAATNGLRRWLRETVQIKNLHKTYFDMAMRYYRRANTELFRQCPKSSDREVFAACLLLAIKYQEDSTSISTAHWAAKLNVRTEVLLDLEYRLLTILDHRLGGELRAN